MARGLRTIRVRFDGDTAGLVAAAAKAGIVVEKFGDQAGNKFLRGVDRGVNRGIGATFVRAAGHAGGRLAADRRGESGSRQHRFQHGQRDGRAEASQEGPTWNHQPAHFLACSFTSPLRIRKGSAVTI
jgi:hypothetical protein